MLKVASDSRDIKKSGPAKRWVEANAMKVFFRHFHGKATAWLYAYDPRVGDGHALTSTSRP